MPKSRLKPPETLPPLRYVESLLLHGYGDITLGRVGPIPCAATACDEDQQLAMLVRRDGETLVQLLVRLDKAIEQVYEHDRFIDEVNNGPDYSL
jgi:hypothetical protein